MIEIYIDNKLVDLDNTNISLQKEFEDEVENIPTEVEYSYTVSIPASMNNKEIFGFADTFDVPNKFARLYNAELYVDETLILSGKFKVTSIEGGYYKGNLYNPKRKSISDILGDRNLNEIIPHKKPMSTLEDYDKINNTVCGLETSSTRLLPEGYRSVKGVFDNHVIFPYVLYSLPLNDIEKNANLDIYTQNLQWKMHNINDNNIYPAFNVISVIKDIFETEGYKLTGNIIDGDMKNYFDGLYQTFQYSHQDYVDNKATTYYCRVIGNYSNYRLNKNGAYNISKSLQSADLWSVDEWRCEHGDDVDHDGKFRYGVDNPWSCGSDNNTITEVFDKKHLFTRGSTDENTGVIIVPKTGWYKISLSGSMKYPYKGKTYYKQSERFNVGGTTDEADNTDLSEQPFEIQLKKGTPAESPKLYSFNSFVPCVPNEFVNDQSIVYDDCNTYLRIEDNLSQRYYGKNGKATYINDYSDSPTNDFVTGVRLGGAWFSAQWTPAAHGYFQRSNRFMTMGAGLALPDVTKTPVIKHYDDERVGRRYKANTNPALDGYYLQLCEKDDNSSYEYAEKTAQCLVKKSSYTNFDGYNALHGNDGHYSWDTSSNYGKVIYEGAENCSASTTDKYSGEWDVNTVVWLEEGDTLYLECLMPYHTGGRYRHSTAFRHSKWVDRVDWINIVDVKYNIEIGYINNKEDWRPKSGDEIPTWGGIDAVRFTNVNQFLPEIKCNDYLNKFLKAFNLQLTMKTQDTYSIDTLGTSTIMGNVIDIDKLCNIDDAEFKPVNTDSIREYKWKIDTSETGYVQGNQSPYKTDHGECVEESAWYDSGYTGSQTLTNEANSSGSVKKVESQWSYNWYKTIHFINGYNSGTTLDIPYADVSVITDSDLWKEGMTYAMASDEAPQTSKASRLFVIKKNNNFNNGIYSYISFKYDEEEIAYGYMRDKVCNLLLTSNFYETINDNSSINRLHLDYTIMNNKYDGLVHNNGLTDKLFDTSIQGGYQIEVPIKLSNNDYANTNAGTLFKLNDGLYKVKSIEGHDVNLEDNATLTLQTLK